MPLITSSNALVPSSFLLPVEMPGATGPLYPSVSGTSSQYPRHFMYSYPYTLTPFQPSQ